MHGSEVLRGTKTWRVPFDAFGDAWIGAKNNLPERKNFWLEWMIKRCQKRIDTF